jgi:hypothetical protein
MTKKSLDPNSKEHEELRKRFFGEGTTELTVEELKAILPYYLTGSIGGNQNHQMAAWAIITNLEMRTAENLAKSSEEASRAAEKMNKSSMKLAKIALGVAIIQLLVADEFWKGLKRLSCYILSAFAD